MSKFYFKNLLLIILNLLFLVFCFWLGFRYLIFPCSIIIFFNFYFYSKEKYPPLSLDNWTFGLSLSGIIIILSALLIPTSKLFFELGNVIYFVAALLYAIKKCKIKYYNQDEKVKKFLKTKHKKIFLVLLILLLGLSIFYLVNPIPQIRHSIIITTVLCAIVALLLISLIFYLIALQQQSKKADLINLTDAITVERMSLVNTMFCVSCCGVFSVLFSVGSLWLVASLSALAPSDVFFKHISIMLAIIIFTAIIVAIISFFTAASLIYKIINVAWKKTVVILAILVIILMLVILRLTVWSSSEVILKMVPADQQDLQQGFIVEIPDFHYIGYEVIVGNMVYMTLDLKTPDYWAINYFEETRPQGIFIKGTIASINRQPVEEPSNDLEDLWADPMLHRSLSIIGVNYGFEQEFASKIKEQNIDLANQEVMAKIKVDKDGNSTLEEIYVNN